MTVPQMTAIRSADSFCAACATPGAGTCDYEAFLGRCEAEAARVLGFSPTTQAFSNTRGRWYAWRIMLDYREFRRAGHFPGKILVPLPPVSVFDCANLYEPSLANLLSDFRQKLHAKTGITLTTSNPDFVILDDPDDALGPMTDTDMSGQLLDAFDLLYLQFFGKCKLQNLHAYVGAKTSVRPDRRIQFLHEGSIYKAVFAHLRTRVYEPDPRVKYFAVSMSFTPADQDGLRSIATHSIASVDSIPERAVDGAFAVHDTDSANVFFLNAFGG